MTDTPIAQDRQLSELVAHLAGSQAAHFDLVQKIPADVIEQLATAGFLGAQVSVEHGGTNYTARELGILCEQTGYASGSLLSLLTVHTMVCSAVARWGSAAQKDRWLPRLASGQLLGAFALSEPNAGSDVSGIETTIEREDGHFIVNGIKKWISCAQVAGLFLVIGKYDGRVITLVMERDTTGLEIAPIGEMLGFRAAMLGELKMKNCVVPQQNLLGSIDFGYHQVVGSMLDQGRFCIAWGCVGIAQACLDACLNYTEHRHTFGAPLKSQQLVLQMIADMAVEVRAARLLCKEAAGARANADEESIMATTMAKYFSARTAESAAAAAMQLHGANGCSSEHHVQRYFRDAKIMGIIEGTSQMQQILIGRHAYRQ